MLSFVYGHGPAASKRQNVFLNSEANASEFVENLKDMSLRYIHTSEPARSNT